MDTNKDYYYYYYYCTLYLFVLLEDHEIFVDESTSHISGSAGFISMTYLTAA